MISPRSFSHPKTSASSAVLLGVLWIVLFFAYGVRHGEIKESYAVFGFNRVAEAATFWSAASDGYAPWIQQVFAFDDETLEQNLIKYHQTAEKLNIFPEASRIHWATALLYFGNHQYAAKLMPEELPEGTAAEQFQFLQWLGEGREVTDEQLNWARQRFALGISEYPEWILLLQNGNEDIESWMLDHGRRMNASGVLFDVIGMIAFFAGLIAISRLWFRNSFFPPPLKLSPIFRRWNGWFVLQQFFIAEILALAAVLFLYRLFEPNGVNDGEMAITHFLFLAIPAGFLAFRLLPKTEMAYKLLLRRDGNWSIRKSLWLGLVFVGSALSTAGLLHFLELFPLSISDVINADNMDTKLRVFWLGIAAVIVAPICEEFIMRGFVFQGLTQSFGAWPAAVVSSFLFAILHGYSLMGFVIVFSMGMVFCWLYRRSGTLWPGIIGHGIYNFVVVNQTLAWYSLH